MSCQKIKEFFNKNKIVILSWMFGAVLGSLLMWKCFGYSYDAEANWTDRCKNAAGGLAGAVAGVTAAHAAGPVYFFHGGVSPEKSPGGNLWTEVNFDRKLCWPAASTLKVHGQARKPKALKEAGEYIGYLTVYKLDPAFYHKGRVSMKIHNDSSCPPGTCGSWSIGARLGYSFGGVHNSKTLPDAYILTEECRKNAGLEPFLVLRIRNPLYKPSGPQAKTAQWQWESDKGWSDYSGEHSAALEHHFQTHLGGDWGLAQKWPELCLKYETCLGERDIKVYYLPDFKAVVQQRQGYDKEFGRPRQIFRRLAPQ